MKDEISDGGLNSRSWSVGPHTFQLVAYSQMTDASGFLELRWRCRFGLPEEESMIDVMSFHPVRWVAPPGFTALVTVVEDGVAAAAIAPDHAIVLLQRKGCSNFADVWDSREGFGTEDWWAPISVVVVRWMGETSATWKQRRLVARLTDGEPGSSARGYRELAYRGERDSYVPTATSPTRTRAGRISVDVGRGPHWNSGRMFGPPEGT